MVLQKFGDQQSDQIITDRERCAYFHAPKAGAALEQILDSLGSIQ
jgi:hypothetical protein